MIDPPTERRTLTVTPSGVIATIALAALVGVFVWLGFWQLERLQERRVVNAGIAARLHAAPIEDAATLADTTGLFYRVVTARGTYDNERTIILPGRSHRGVPGVHMLTPLHLHERTDAVLVNRGWIPSADAATVPIDQFAVVGDVTVRGLVYPFPSAAASLAPPRPSSDAESGFRQIWYSVHEPTLRAQFPYRLLSVMLQEMPSEGAARYPVRLDAPPLDEGPHLGYALQWFSFALIGIVGWIALVLKQRATPRVVPPVTVAALLLVFANSASAQLRPLDPMAWRVYEPGTFLVGTAGVGALWQQPATLAGTRGRLLELGNYNVTFRFDRMAIELAGTALWRLTEDSVVQAPASWVEPANGSMRQDAGYASAATLVNLTPDRAPVDIVVRFGARIPTTSDETGLERDRTDFFAVAGFRYRTGPLAFAMENGVGIHGTTDPGYPQSDVWTYAFSAEYQDDLFFGTAQLVGHQDGHRRVRRGNEDLRELRIGGGVGRDRWVRLTYIRGLSDYSPRHGVRLTTGLRLSPWF